MTDFPFTELQLKLIEALKSGKYKQGSNYLRREGKYCVLGVAAEVLGLEVHSYDVELGGWRALHLRSPLGIFDLEYIRRLPHKEYGGFYGLSALNDAAKWTFPQIAAFMERHPWALFTNMDE